MQQPQPFPQDDPPSNSRTPYRKTATDGGNLRSARKQLSGVSAITESPLKTRPKTTRQQQEEQLRAQKDLQASKPSEKNAFTDKDAELEHLRSEVEIYKQRVQVLEDLQTQNRTLQAQLDASSTSNEQQLKVNAQQAQLIIAQSQQIQALQGEKELLSDQVLELEGLRSQHQEMMTQTVQYMEELENRVFETNQVSLQLLKQIRDQTEEIETIKIYCMDLKSKVSVYIPLKDDPVDIKLADFVNNYPDRKTLKIMFLREAQGIYQFGTKRVEVRISKGKLTIRGGGGYLTIDEFLDQNTAIELAKVERRDPLKKFQEKLSMAKSMQGRDVSPMNTRD